MKKLKIIIALLFVVAVAEGILLVNKSKTNSSPVAVQQKQNSKKVLYWRAPMNPNEVYNHPGKSKMGMDLVPVYADEGSAQGVVSIDPAMQQDMNVKIDTVKERNISTNVITNGVLVTDETKEYIVTTKVNGWVQKLFVNYTGDKIIKGTKLMEIYSPELVSAEQEFLSALSFQNSVQGNSNNDVSSSGSQLVENARKKLELLDLPDNDIQELEKTKQLKTYITLYAPYSGTVLEKNIVEGQKINAGMSLLHIADLSKLWLQADIYETELSKIKLGSTAKIRFNYMPGKVYNGIVSFIYPTIDKMTRTVKVRLDINNSTGELKPDMYANVEIEGKNLGLFPTVPEQSVIRSGINNIVILSLGNGKFKPVDVELGVYANGYYQILKGLSSGERIVTSAQFLIDSESNLKAALNQFSNGASSDKPAAMENMNDSKK